MHPPKRIFVVPASCSAARMKTNSECGYRELSELRRRKGLKSPFGHTPISFNAIDRGDSLRMR